MQLNSFEALHWAARQQSEGQRFLLVFVRKALPEDANRAQTERFEAGMGGALVPVMYADKALHEVDDFASLVAEAERSGKILGKGQGADWDMVIVGCLGGYGEREPSSKEAEQPLKDLVRCIRSGGSLMHLIGFDRDGISVNFQ